LWLGHTQRKTDRVYAEDPVEKMLAVPNRLQKVNGWSCSSKMCHPPRLGCDYLSNWCRPRMAKLFDPRAEFATAWPLEGCIQCDLRDRQQPMLLHRCPQSETWHLKKCARYLAGRMWSAGRSFATPGVDRREVVTAHTLVGVQYLGWTVVIYFSRHGHKLLSGNTLTWQPVTGGRQHHSLLPQHSPKIFTRNPIVCFLEVDKTCKRKISQKCAGEWNFCL